MWCGVVWWERRPWHWPLVCVVTESHSDLKKGGRGVLRGVPTSAGKPHAPTPKGDDSYRQTRAESRPSLRSQGLRSERKREREREREGEPGGPLTRSATATARGVNSIPNVQGQGISMGSRAHTRAHTHTQGERFFH